MKVEAMVSHNHKVSELESPLVKKRLKDLHLRRKLVAKKDLEKPRKLNCQVAVISAAGLGRAQFSQHCGLSG